MNAEAKLTQKFLRAIARRLSGRVECHRVEYLLGIGQQIASSDIIVPNTGEESDYVYFLPNVYTYRDTHHRSDQDLYRVADLILHKYFPDLVLGRDDYGQLKVDTSKLVQGTYKYQLSVDGKRRRWVRMFTRNR